MCGLPRAQQGRAHQGRSTKVEGPGPIDGQKLTQQAIDFLPRAPSPILGTPWHIDTFEHHLARSHRPHVHEGAPQNGMPADDVFPRVTKPWTIERTFELNFPLLEGRCTLDTVH